MNTRARLCRFGRLAGIVVSALTITGSLSLSLPARAQEFVINEVLAVNDTPFVDGDGDASDWIELYNSTETTTALTGWYLSDDPTFLRKWRFPLANIPLRSYLVVFASGKNRTNTTELHTNFKLDADGEFLALIKPDGITIASQFAPKFPRQRRNISFGRGADGTLHYLAPPTPGRTNATNYAQFVADTKFSVDRGFFGAPISVVITTATAGATIYFTTNGSVPSPTNGAVYSGPIPITRTTGLRAAAHKPGCEPSNIDTQTYLFLQDIVGQDFAQVIARGFPATWGGTNADYAFDPDVIGKNGTDLFGGKYTASISNDLRSVPSVCLTLPVNDLFGTNGIYMDSFQSGDEVERPASFELLFPDGRKSVHVNAGLRLQGGFFRLHFVTLKHSFRLIFREQYGASQLKEPLFGPAAARQFNTLVLRAGANDGYAWDDARAQPLYIRDSFIRQTITEMGRPSARDFFVHLYLNGVYWGLYDLTERPDASFASTYFGGQEDDWDALNDNGVSNGSATAWNSFLSLCSGGLSGSLAYLYQRVLGKNPDGTPNPTYPRYLDVDAMNDYLIALFWGGVRDWPFKNYWLLRHRTNNTGFQYMAWDTEISVGLLDTNATFNSTVVTDGVATPYGAARANPEYRLAFADRVHRHLFNGGPLYVDPLNPAWDPAHPERNRPAARFATLAAQIEKAMVAESARWGDQHRAIPYTRDEQWLVEKNFILTNWFSKRSSNVLQQFRAAGLYPNLAAPTFSQHGGAISPGFQLTITAPAGQVFVTTNGMDPRLTNNATLYAAPLSLWTNVTIKARAWNGIEWSALNEAFFATARPNLVITEIHYHPADPSVTERNAGFSNADDFEFLEILNADATPLALAGLRLTNAVRFDFASASMATLAPQQVVLLVKNPAAFQIRYGNGLPVIGQYQGNLANDGESIVLLSSAGPVLNLTYGTESPWPTVADGSGPSLELLSVGGDVGSPTNWQASAESGGTPGHLPGLRIESIRLLAGNVVLQFRGFADRSVLLWFKDSLQDPEWNFLETSPAEGVAVREIEDDWQAGQTQRFYRLSAP